MVPYVCMSSANRKATRQLVTALFRYAVRPTTLVGLREGAPPRFEKGPTRLCQADLPPILAFSCPVTRAPDPMCNRNHPEGSSSLD